MKNLITALTLMTVLVLLKINEVYIPNRIVRSQPTELEKFLDHMAERESDNTHSVVNRFGMMGKYQFDPTPSKFLDLRLRETSFLPIQNYKTL